MSAPATPISHVSDTARWVAMYRAMESDRPDALFHDRWARQLAGPQGEAILRHLPKARRTSWPMIVRTQVMDELILRAIREDGVDTVLNLAAGLDTRPYRLPLPKSLRWIEADFDDVLNYKKGVLAQEQPNCALELAPVDLTDAAARTQLFARLAASSRHTFVIAEGLLVYLQSDQVARLAADLAAQPSFQFWLIDLSSPELLKRLNKVWGKSMEQTPLIFGPAEGTEFFEPHGWREKEFRSMFMEALRLKRTMRFAWLYVFLGRLAPEERRAQLRRMSGIVLLERR